MGRSRGPGTRRQDPSPGRIHRDHVDGEGRRKGREGEGSPRLADPAAPYPPASRRTGDGGVGCGPHLPISRTIKTTFKFFSPGLISFIKRGGSLTPFILRQVRLRLRRRGWERSGTKLPTLPGQGRGWKGDLGRGWREKGQKAVSEGPRKPAQTALSLKKKKKKSAHKFKRKKKKDKPLRTPTPLPTGRQEGNRANRPLLWINGRKKGSEETPLL